MNPFDELIKKVVEDNIKDVENIAKEVRGMCVRGVLPKTGKNVDSFLGIVEVR